MRYYLILFILSLFHFSQKNVNAQSYNPNPQTWVIDSETSTCENSNNECLLIKQPGKKEFEIFNETIEGFDYEKGIIYTIIVRQEIKQPPIAIGESVFKYVLVKIVSKKQKINNTVSTGQQKIFEVNFETVPCEDNNSKACLLIKEKGKNEFEIFNANIYGFNYQPGYSYTIAVKETTNGNYYLVNEISKKFVQSSSATYILPVENNAEIKETSSFKPGSGKIIQPTKIQTTSSLDGKWYLRKMKESDGFSFVTDDNVMWIEINTFNDHIDGFGACNKFAAVIKSDLNTTFLVSKITSAYSNCGNKKLEDLFYNLLEQANRFEIRNGNLILSNQWNFLLGFTVNANNKEDISSTYTPPAIVKNDDKVYATNQSIGKNEDKYVPPVKTSTTTETTTNTSNTTVTKKDNEVDDLKKQIEILQKQVEAKQQQPNSSSTVGSNISTDKNSQSFSYTESSSSNLKDVNNIGYSNGNTIENLENAISVYNDNSLNKFYLISPNHSPVRFSKTDIPTIVIEMKENKDPLDVFTLFFSSDDNKERKFNPNNTINFGYKILKPNLYQVVFSSNLEMGEYAFISTENSNILNLSKVQAYCFRVNK